MTTYKGIAAVTYTLAHLLTTSIAEPLPEAILTVGALDERGAGTPDSPRLNVLLVQVSPVTDTIAGLQAAHSPSTATPASLKLSYLLSYFGPPQKAQLMLGATELALHQHPVLEPTLIRTALANHPDLQDCELDQQDNRMRMLPSPIRLDELTRLWSRLAATPYTVSTLYEASVLILTPA